MVVDSDLYPTQTYRDPLLFPLYLRTNDSSSIHAQTQCDWLLKAYVNKIDQEIVDDIPEFAEQKELIVKIFDACRTHGWVAIQPYEESYRIFTPLQRTDWIKKVDPESKKNIRIGMKVHWSDDLGNSWSDDLYFVDFTDDKGNTYQKCYLVVWEEGNGMPLANAPADSAFAIADVNNAILSLAIQCRQIQATLTFSATNPYFYHFKYGDAITPQQRSALMQQMVYVNSTTGIGAKESVLKEIIAIENGATEKSIVALDQMISFFSAATRLPLSYYLGEKQTGGLGDTGESTDLVLVNKKKEFILNHFLPFLQQFFQEQFGETLPDLSKFYTKKMEEDQEHKEELMKESQANQKPEEVKS